MRFSPHHRFIWAETSEFDAVENSNIHFLAADQKLNGWEFDEEIEEIEDSLETT